MGHKPTTFRTLVGRSNHWPTENSNGEQWSFVGDTTTASRKSHYVNEHTHLTASRSHVVLSE